MAKYFSTGGRFSLSLFKPQSAFVWIVLLLNLLFRCTITQAFSQYKSVTTLQRQRCCFHTHNHQSTTTVLYDIHNWRDIDYGYPGRDRALGVESGPLPKSICILPFDHREVLLQGETKQLRLYENRFLKLFEDAMQNHGGVVAMGLMANSGVIQTVPLCEIEAYQRMDGFGIFVTIRCVGRAQLIEITQQEPYLKAVCTEVTDSLPPNLELPNLVASNIENLVLLLSSMEHRLKQAKISSNVENIDDPEMKRRIAIAKLEDRYYDDDATDTDTDSDDDEDDDSSNKVSNNIRNDRRGRFRQAYQLALDTDTQGYQLQDATGDRTPQELTALSWAAFQTDPLLEDIATYRIQALDANSLFDRLKLALHMLQEKKSALRDQMQKAGLNLRDSEKDDSQN